MKRLCWDCRTRRQHLHRNQSLVEDSPHSSLTPLIDTGSRGRRQKARALAESASLDRPSLLLGLRPATQIERHTQPWHKDVLQSKKVQEDNPVLDHLAGGGIHTVFQSSIPSSHLSPMNHQLVQE